MLIITAKFELFQIVKVNNNQNINIHVETKKQSTITGNQTIFSNAILDHEDNIISILENGMKLLNKHKFINTFMILKYLQV